MKKTIYLSLFFLITTLSFAQKVTKDNLQGTWQIVAIDVKATQGIYVDFIKNDIEFSDAIKNQADEESLKQAKAEFAGTMEMLKLTKMVVNDAKLTMYTATDIQNSKYVITEKDGNQLLLLTFEGGTEDSVKTYFKDKLLYIDTVTDGIFIYKKV